MTPIQVDTVIFLEGQILILKSNSLIFMAMFFVELTMLIRPHALMRQQV